MFAGEGSSILNQASIAIARVDQGITTDLHMNISRENSTLFPTGESFEALLHWLDPDRERAGVRYEEIRRRLVRIFTYRGCLGAEYLADETINRVIRNVESARSFSGDPVRYFYGVANKVHLEYVRTRPANSVDSDEPKGLEQVRIEFSCLEECLSTLSPENRELILQYYERKKSSKGEVRQQLAANLGIGVNALRIRAYRVRSSLVECIEGCMNKLSTNR